MTNRTPTRERAMSRNWDEPIGQMTTRIDHTSEEVTEGFPHFADSATGRWTTSPDGDWTGGFWNGMLWLTYHRTCDPKYLGLAERFAARLDPRAESDSVFRGFLFYYGAVLGTILSGNEEAERIALRGARGLAESFNPAARVLPLGNAAEEASDVGHGEQNIDGVPGGALLTWAATRTGEQSLADIGIQNGLRNIDFCLRDDGSVIQSASFDTESGALVRTYTHKGYTDESVWARAQAWGMLGWSMMSYWSPEEKRLLEAAVTASDWWIAHVPDDSVSYWDFDAPIHRQPVRDTSATAIAAAALLKVATQLGSPAGDPYRAFAEETVATLVDSYLTPVDPADARLPGMLTKSCYNHRIGLATDNELIWGDYFLYEALHVLAGHVEATQI